MESLPKDIKREIADKLTNEDLLVFCKMVSKKHLASVCNEDFWRMQFHRRFPTFERSSPSESWKDAFLDAMRTKVKFFELKSVITETATYIVFHKAFLPEDVQSDDIVYRKMPDGTLIFFIITDIWDNSIDAVRLPLENIGGVWKLVKYHKNKKLYEKKYNELIKIK